MSQNFEDDVKKIVSRIPQIKARVGSEEATKTGLIMPMLEALGYDSFNIDEVCPEYTADFGTKAREKVDYAILKDGVPLMLIECKPAYTELTNKHGSQLFRYFSTTDVKIAILTNGIKYKFFSDFEAPNKMDKKPFLEINLETVTDGQLAELKRFSKEELNLDELLPNAMNMIALQNVMDALKDEIDSPSDELIKMLVVRFSDERCTQKFLDKYRPLVKGAFNQLINDKIHSRLMNVMEQSDSKEAMEAADALDEIITTDEELRGFHIVQAIAVKVTTIDRIAIRDSKSYCAVLFDDNNRKPIVRLHFNGKQKYVSIFHPDKTEEKFPVDRPADLYTYQDQIVEVIRSYL